MADPPQLPLVVVVPEHELSEPEAGFGRRHAIYRIVCKEGHGAEWHVKRRWTELRLTYDALLRTHQDALRSAPGSWSRCGNSLVRWTAQVKLLGAACAPLDLGRSILGKQV